MRAPSCHTGNARRYRYVYSTTPSGSSLAAPGRWVEQPLQSSTVSVKNSSEAEKQTKANPGQLSEGRLKILSVVATLRNYPEETMSRTSSFWLGFVPSYYPHTSRNRNYLRVHPRPVWQSICGNPLSPVSHGSNPDALTASTCLVFTRVSTNGSQPLQQPMF